jgi:BirA family transcriptional regulator, biotin operon repressor / biotin---[acetyl-CoA-carboxylase] ligase
MVVTMTVPEDSRPPLDPTLAKPASGRWRVEVVETSGSTNADVAQRFREGEPEGLVLAAEHQTAGRGRLGRDWVTSPRSSLTVSLLVVPDQVAAERWSWLPLLTGVAAAEAVRRVAGVDVALKWPNDVLVEGRKLGGILLERISSSSQNEAAAILGVGINCHQSEEELPVPEATSLDLVTGDRVDRSALLRELVEQVDRRLRDWSGDDAALEEVKSAYRVLCSTIGQQVRVAVPGGDVTGEATAVDEGGRLVVHTADGEQRLGAGDVVHVRRQE